MIKGLLKWLFPPKLLKLKKISNTLISPAVVTREFIRLLVTEGYSGRALTENDSFEQLHVDWIFNESDREQSIDWYSKNVLLPFVTQIVSKCDPGQVFVSDELKLPDGMFAINESLNGVTVRCIRYSDFSSPMIRLDFRVLK